MELDSAGRQPRGQGPDGFGFGEGEGPVSERDIMTAARAGGCVLLTGPSADCLTLARRIHGESSRRERPFAVIDCADPNAGLIGPLLEALGGGATARLGGHPATPQAGTVYFKDVGQMPLDVQRMMAELLARPGRSRVIASNPEPLLGRVIDGAFDDCLFYRLNVIHIVLGASGESEGSHFTV